MESQTGNAGAGAGRLKFNQTRPHSCQRPVVTCYSSHSYTSVWTYNQNILTTWPVAIVGVLFEDVTHAPNHLLFAIVATRCSAVEPAQTMVSPGVSVSTVSVSVLDPDRHKIFKQALSNVLSTELAEFTMAQLVDGLPTIDV